MNLIDPETNEVITPKRAFDIICELARKPRKPVNLFEYWTKEMVEHLNSCLETSDKLPEIKPPEIPYKNSISGKYVFKKGFKISKPKEKVITGLTKEEIISYLEKIYNKRRRYYE